jgi:hypothetical protein
VFTARYALSLYIRQNAFRLYRVNRSSKAISCNMAEVTKQAHVLIEKILKKTSNTLIT